MEKNEGHTDRFVEVVKKIGGNRKAAAAMGRSDKSVERYKKGAEVPFDAMCLLLEAADINMHWFLTGKGGRDRQAFETSLLESGSLSLTTDQAQSPVNKELFNVPVMNVTASAGDGRVVISEATSGYIGFDAAWLRTSYNLNPNDLYAMPTVGESMEPTIKAGEFLICSRSEHHIKPADGIYVIRLDGNVLVKRIQLLPGGLLHVSSDNPAYKPFDLKLGDPGTDLVILGKVVLVHGVRRL